MAKHILLLIFLSCFSSSVFADSLPPEAASGFKAKSAITANSHMTVSGHALASEAGNAILRYGGNAVDAAIATQLMLNLVEPQSSGIGGGGFLLYYDKQSKTIS